jgi:hypothetical protein
MIRVYKSSVLHLFSTDRRWSTTDGTFFPRRSMEACVRPWLRLIKIVCPAKATTYSLTPCYHCVLLVPYIKRQCLVASILNPIEQSDQVQQTSHCSSPTPLAAIVSPTLCILHLHVAQCIFILDVK